MELIGVSPFQKFLIKLILTKFEIEETTEWF